MVNVAKFFALLFFASTILGIEFDENVLAHTSHSYVPINQIKPRDTLIYYDINNKILAQNVFPVVASITVSWGVDGAIEDSIAIGGTILAAFAKKSWDERACRNIMTREPSREPSNEVWRKQWKN